ncbi:MAG: DUF5130 family protein [Mycobacteriales bacterium]
MVAGDAVAAAQPDMATSAPPLTRRQLRRIERMVAAAERASGLQFCVYVGPTEDHPRAHAERLLTAAGARRQPAVLVLVAPAVRRFEIVTAPMARQRLSDRACRLAAASMAASFAVGDLAGGVVTGLSMLAESAGRPDQSAALGEQLPDVLSG